MQIAEAEARKLFVTLGTIAAKIWPVPKLETRLNAIDKVWEDGKPLDKDSEEGKLLAKCLKSIGSIEIERAKPKENTVKKKGKAKAKKHETNGAVTKKESKPRGVGVVATIVELLKKGSAKKPVSRESVLEELGKRFPDRETKSMANTLSQTPYDLKQKGIVVQKNEDGMWI